MAQTVTLPVVIEPSQIESGMTLRIHQKIKDVSPSGEEKERVQVFEGIVLNLGGAGKSRSMTVRKVSGGIGVEKIFPLNLPTIVKVELTKFARVRRKNIEFVRTSKKRLRDVKNIKLHVATEVKTETK
ncbi:50S ribosomal protein L19 [Patescibacteria group bacterium]|nr:50S ribosomal protein L19 [Patescibacteria group bacterium]